MMEIKSSIMNPNHNWWDWFKIDFVFNNSNIKLIRNIVFNVPNPSISTIHKYKTKFLRLRTLIFQINKTREKWKTHINLYLFCYFVLGYSIFILIMRVSSFIFFFTLKFYKIHDNCFKLVHKFLLFEMLWTSFLETSSKTICTTFFKKKTSL